MLSSGKLCESLWLPQWIKYWRWESAWLPRPVHKEFTAFSLPPSPPPLSFVLSLSLSCYHWVSVSLSFSPHISWHIRRETCLRSSGGPALSCFQLLARALTCMCLRELSDDFRSYPYAANLIRAEWSQPSSHPSWYWVIQWSKDRQSSSNSPNCRFMSNINVVIVLSYYILCGLLHRNR